MSPEAAQNPTGVVQRIVQCPVSLAFRARVYGIMDGAVYLSGRITEGAVSFVVPFAVLERRPELGEEIPLSVRIGEAPHG